MSLGTSPALVRCVITNPVPVRGLGRKQALNTGSGPASAKRKFCLPCRTAKHGRFSIYLQRCTGALKVNPLPRGNLWNVCSMICRNFLIMKTGCGRYGAIPTTREKLLSDLSEAGYDAEKLDSMKELIDAKDSDVYDVLAFVAYAV